MRLSFSLFLFFFFLQGLQAQNPFSFHYDTKDGLPSSETYDVIQDGNGYIWCTTDRGVCRYDGYTFKTYSTREGLSNNTNFKLKRDRQGNLWVLSADGNLAVYKFGQFETLPAISGLKQVVGNRSLTQVLFDEKNNPLVYDKDVELAYVDRNLIRSRNKIWPTVYGIRSGRFSAITLPVLKRYDHLFDTIKLSLYYSGEREAFVWLDGYGFIGANYKRGAEGVYCVVGNQLLYWDLKTNSIQRNSRHTGELIQSIYVDANGDLWVCTRTGVYQYKLGQIGANPRHFFDEYNFTGMVQDREGNYWLSIWNRGLLMVPSFDFARVSFGNASGFQRILSLAVFNKYLVAGTSENSLFAFDKTMHRFELFREHAPDKPNVPIEYQSVIDDVLWVTGGHRFISKGPHIMALPVIKFSTSFYNKLQNGYWINGEPGPTNLYSRKGDEFILEQKIISSRLRSMVTDNQGAIWLGTENGLFKLNTGDLKHPDSLAGEFFFLSGRICDIKESPGHSFIAIATRNHGLVLSSSSGFSLYNVDSGIISNHINRLYFQNDSVLWVCTNKGLMCLQFTLGAAELQLKEKSYFNISDGLLSNFVNDVVVWNNQLFIATNEGLNAIALDKIPGVKTFPALSDLHLRTTDSTYFFRSDQLIELNYSDHYIEMNFSGVCFKKPEGVPFYRYRLAGLGSDNNWQRTNERSVRFINLPAGSYSFEVQALNKNGEAGPLSVFRFTVAPHFSKTWWFRSLLALLLAGTVILIFFRRLNDARKKAAIKSQLKEAELKWKDAELEALRNQMNPHFVYNSLNSIQNFIFNHDIDKANDYIVRFSRLMRSSLEHSRLDFISLKDEIEFIGNYLYLENIRFEQRFEYTLHLSDNIKPSEVFIPPLILQPLLENCVKHAFGRMTEKGLISIQVEEAEQAKHLKIIISDNGSGIGTDTEKPVPANGKKSLGIEIIRKRIQLLKEKFLGSEPYFVLLNRQTSGLSSGTTAILVLPYENIWE